MQVRNTTLDDLANIIGFSATVRLSAFFGGKNLYIPASISPGQVIVTLIGEPAARRLSDEFGREHIALPSLHGPLREQRNSTIYYRLVAGESPRQISAAIGLTERRVIQIKCELERLGLLPRKSAEKSWQKNRGESL